MSSACKTNGGPQHDEGVPVTWLRRSRDSNAAAVRPGTADSGRGRVPARDRRPVPSARGCSFGRRPVAESRCGQWTLWNRAGSIRPTEPNQRGWVRRGEPNANRVSVLSRAKSSRTVSFPLVETSYRNDATHGLTRDARTETFGRHRFYHEFAPGACPTLRPVMAVSFAVRSSWAVALGPDADAERS